jgi:hypothetical protein
MLQNCVLKVLGLNTGRVTGCYDGLFFLHPGCCITLELQPHLKSLCNHNSGLSSRLVQSCITTATETEQIM